MTHECNWLDDDDDDENTATTNDDDNYYKYIWYKNSSLEMHIKKINIQHIYMFTDIIKEWIQKFSQDSSIIRALIGHCIRHQHQPANWSTYTHTHAHTHMHKCMCAIMHARTHAHTHIHTHTHEHAYLCTHADTHTLTMHCTAKTKLQPKANQQDTYTVQSTTNYDHHIQPYLIHQYHL